MVVGMPEGVREGRLHYYDGRLVESPPGDPSDASAMFEMFEAVDEGGVSSDDVMAAAKRGEYAMADYVAEGETLRIAFKEDEGLGLAIVPAVRDDAERSFREWASREGLTDVEFVPYEDLLSGRHESP